jgi:hypothetical protein
MQPAHFQAAGDETGKNRGLKREAELILLYYVPHEPLSRWILPWAPKQI